MPPVPVVDDAILRRIRAEYTEMPGLRLTMAQAQRLWNLDPASCEAILTKLVETKVLACAVQGSTVVFKSAA